jgi:hypothetical protein
MEYALFVGVATSRLAVTKLLLSGSTLTESLGDECAPLTHVDSKASTANNLNIIILILTIYCTNALQRYELEALLHENLFNNSQYLTKENALATSRHRHFHKQKKFEEKDPVSKKMLIKLTFSTL